MWLVACATSYATAMPLWLVPLEMFEIMYDPAGDLPTKALSHQGDLSADP
jgi:hypothetical protein